MDFNPHFLNYPAPTFLTLLALCFLYHLVISPKPKRHTSGTGSIRTENENVPP
jgi:hypothetical protein